ncbi:DUF2786 domain-containing protein [Microcella daejeonensis]|uniref:DUF2786 domain-containing protein n=1 Tax=Microcella daejeonensis TaxID=2994971 RepID=UPI00226FCA5B|nr:DUF2786 domain-containing protein [Microcella daejeonensis]WAB84981.1 DUF2786 domain-containing protein [Microcella daejeonensis]
MDQKTRMRDRIQVLLRQAETATSYEAEAMTTAATELMLQYSITPEDLEQPEHADHIMWRDYLLNGPYVDALVVGVSTLSRALNAECILLHAYGEHRHFLHGRKARGNAIRLIAHVSDLDNVINLLRSVTRQALTAATRWAELMLMHHKVKVTPQDRRSFLLGYFTAAAEKVDSDRSRIATEQDAHGELARADRWAAVRNWARNEFDLDEKELFTGVTSGSDFGLDYGRSANVGRA